MFFSILRNCYAPFGPERMREGMENDDNNLEMKSRSYCQHASSVRIFHFVIHMKIKYFLKTFLNFIQHLIVYLT